MQTTVSCPACGSLITLKSGKPGRLIGTCHCNPTGPVIEVGIETVPDPLRELDGIGPEVAEVLHRRGIHSLDDVAQTSDEDLLAVPGIGPATLLKIRRNVVVTDRVYR